jgi:hypothetical protein
MALWGTLIHTIPMIMLYLWAGNFSAGLTWNHTFNRQVDLQKKKKKK